MSEKEDISEIIKTVRETLNLSQEELASKLGVSFSTLNGWENGRRIPRKKHFDKIMETAEEAEGLERAIPRYRLNTKRDVLSAKMMEQMLWKAACSIRGEKDAPKFKDYLLPLVFLKRLSDVFDDEMKRLAEEHGSMERAEKMVGKDKALVRFYLPPQTRWEVLSGRGSFEWDRGKKPKTLGELITTTMRTVARENPPLVGVIDLVDYNETKGGEREISDEGLKGVIEAFSNPKYRLGLLDVEPDFLGRCYEYLLRKFAEESGKSAGEFFTPTEVGRLMARIMKPAQGETVYDYACGSAGLLIKCELALLERDPDVKKGGNPLKLFGQELGGDNYAMAQMNAIIHDMECEIARGNSMTNPKFLSGTGGLRTFDIVVANPMWNQQFPVSAYEDDRFDRFESQGGTTTGKADWAWLQHTAKSLNGRGRAAVVIDTGAVTRGSGAAGEDKEKKIRKWFVENDLVDGVILLPENLFYNVTAAGIIIILNKNKSPERKGKIVLINASGEFKKGRPKNYLTDGGISRIADVFLNGKDFGRFAKVVTAKQAAENDYNLSPSRYIDTAEKEICRPITDIWAELKTLEKEAKKTDREIERIFREMGAGE